MMGAAKTINKKREFLPNWRKISDVQDIDLENLEEEKMSEESGSHLQYAGTSPRSQDNRSVQGGGGHLPIKFTLDAHSSQGLRE